MFRVFTGLPGSLVFKVAGLYYFPTNFKLQTKNLKLIHEETDQFCFAQNTEAVFAIV